MGRRVIEVLPPIDPEQVPDDVVATGRDHPMRMVTHAAAAEVGAWDDGTRRQVAGYFDQLADEWHTRHTADKLLALQDALIRGGGHLGGLPASRPWVELGSGDGWATATIAAHAPALLSVELSAGMVAIAPRGSWLVRGDASALPLADHAVDVAVLMNMLLFPSELDRVLAPGGVVVWVSSRGAATPIHLTGEQVAAALPGRWAGATSQHGTTTWTVLRRAG